MSSSDQESLATFAKKVVVIIILPLIAISAIGLTSLAAYVIHELPKALMLAGSMFGAAISHASFWGVVLWRHYRRP